MANPIRVDFQVGGIKDVLEAFNSVTQAAKRYEREQNKLSNTRNRAAKEDAATTQAQERTKTSATERGERQRSRERESALKYVANLRNRYFEQQQRQEEKAARESERTHQRSLDYVANLRRRYFEQQQREEERAEQKRLRTIERSNRQAESLARASAERTEANRRRIAGSVASTVTSSVGSGVTRLMGAASMVTGIMGGFTLADSAQRGLDTRGAAADLANQSGRKVAASDILANASRVGTQFGADTMSVIGGLDAFVAKSGDVQAGMQGLAQLVELATATGADLRELSQTAGIIHMGTGNMAETMRQMRVLAGAGREGSVDMRELSQYAGRISSGANQFVSKGAAFSQLSAVVQQAAATGGATAAPEATEAVTRLSTDVIEHRARFDSLGIKTVDKSGKYLLDPKEIIKESIIKTKGDSSLLLELFGKQSIRAVAGFQDIYNRAGGGQAGEEAMEAAFRKFEKAELSEVTVRQDAASRMQEADKQFAAVMNELREKVAAELIPVLIQLAPQIRELIPAFVDLVKAGVDFATWLKDNPLKGIGAIMAAQVTADLAAAGLGQVITSGLTAVFARLGGSVATAGAGVAAAGAGATAGAAALTAGVVLSAGMAAGGYYLSQASDDQVTRMKEAQADASELSALKKDTAGLFGRLQDTKNTVSDPILNHMQTGEIQAQIDAKLKRVQELTQRATARKEKSENYVEKTMLGAIGQGDVYKSKVASENRLNDPLLAELNATMKKFVDGLSQLNGNQSGGSPPSMLRPETTVSLSSPARASQ